MKYIVSFLFLFVSMFSCAGKTTNDSLIPDENTVKIERFDKYFYTYLKQPNGAYQTILKTKYPDLLAVFGLVTVQNSDVNDPHFFPALNAYFSNSALAQIYTDTQNIFENVAVYEKELSEANRIIFEKMNNKRLPLLTTHVSGFKENTLVLENCISISIDKYLGSDYPQYKRFFEDYQRIQMQPMMISRDYLKAWILSQMSTSTKKTNLLTEMIQEGKVLYILSQLLPEWEKLDLIGYNAEKYTWCTERDDLIWQSIIKQNHLYSDDYLVITKYMDDALYTSTISKDSPGRVGAFVGWQIVEQYAQNTGTSLDAILHMDAQTILKDSKYNP